MTARLVAENQQRGRLVSTEPALKVGVAETAKMERSGICGRVRYKLVRVPAEEIYVPRERRLKLRIERDLYSCIPEIKHSKLDGGGCSHPAKPWTVVLRRMREDDRQTDGRECGEIGHDY